MKFLKVYGYVCFAAVSIGTVIYWLSLFWTEFMTCVVAFAVVALIFAAMIYYELYGDRSNYGGH